MFACTSLSDSGVDYMGHKLHLESNKAKTNEKESKKGERNLCSV